MKTITITLPDEVEDYADAEMIILVTNGTVMPEYAVAVLNADTGYAEEVGEGGSIHDLLRDAGKIVRAEMRP